MTACPIQRVLVVSFSVVPSSDHQGVAIETVIKAVAPRFQVDVLTIRSAEMGYVERYNRTRMLRVPVGGGTRSEQVDAFRRAVRRQLEGAEYDLIHFRSAYGGVPICQLREYLDCKLVFELALTSSREAGRLDTVGLQSLITDERFCVAHADLLITYGDSAAKALQAAGVACPVAVVPPGVDVDTFDWEPAVPQPIRRIVYVGTLGPARGLRTLLESFARVCHDLESHLVLVGPVQERFSDYLNDAISRLGIRDHVQLVGAVDHEEIPRILAMADVCVSPWAPNPGQPLTGPPLKLLEYLACRRPTVAVDQPVIREFLGDSAGALLVPPDDPDAMATAIRQLLTEPQRGEALAHVGYERVRERYGASAARRSLLTAYSRVVPSGANLWGHAGVVQPVTTSSAGTNRFRDTLHDDRAQVVTVTPTATVPAEPAAGPVESWVLVTPDTATDFVSPAHHGEASTDPEFTAAGELLTGSAGGPTTGSAAGPTTGPTGPTTGPTGPDGSTTGPTGPTTGSAAGPTTGPDGAQ